MSQHFVKKPPAVGCGGRWNWSLAGDLNWLNESLNDSWPVEIEGRRRVAVTLHIRKEVNLDGRSWWRSENSRRWRED